jgi:hypothetical protein
MFPDLSENDARQAIETLMEEEESIAEDPTQNAMLSQAPGVRMPEEMDEPDSQAVQESQSAQAGVGEPEDVPVPEQPPDEAVELDEYDPNTAVAQSDDVPLPAQDAQDAPESDLAVEDESDAIQAPDAATGDSGMSDEQYVEAAEPLSLPEFGVNRREAEPWQDGQFVTDPDPEPEEADDPYGRAMADTDWKMTLSARGQSLS